MTQQTNEKITRSAKVASIDIDGIIGTPEQEQFGTLDGRVATYERFVEALEEVRQGGVDKLVINIRSTGGDLGDALLIYDAARELGVQVITRCYGYVASAATIIAQAASKGCREISANSLYLIHCCESSVEGNAHNLSATQLLLEKSDQRVAEVYALASGRAPEEFRELMNQNGGRGSWLTPEEAIEQGLVDTIIAAESISNDATGQLASLGLPPLPEPKRTLRGRVVEGCASLLSKVGLKGLFEERGRRVATHNPSPVPHASAADSPVVDEAPTPPTRISTARATVTQPTEDPLPASPVKHQGNSAAYQGDLEGMKEALRSAAVK